MSADSLGPGTIIAGYRLERVLGRGGMGVVYEATQLSLNRTVALKLVSPLLGDDLPFRARFKREGRLQASLDHPNIVTVHEAGEFNGTLFIAMRLVRGVSLKEMILARQLDAGRSLRILGPVADALDGAHEAGLIHRDVKPHNILVGVRDHPYLADFGVAKSRSSTEMTRTGQFVGSLDYMSPEQIRGEPVTAASDIYSLGAVLFECLAGVVPFPKESDAAVLYAHVAEPPPMITEQRASLPRALDEVIARAMAKDPAERPSSGDELMSQAERAFSPPARIAMELPAPITSPVEVGMREPERDVGTEISQTARAENPTPRIAEPRAETTVAASPRPSIPRRFWLLTAGVLAGLLALGVGFAVGHSGTPRKSTIVSTVAASAGPLTLAVPATWTVSRAGPSVPGLRLMNALARNDSALGGELFAGSLPDAQAPRLLPPGFERELARRPPGSEPVRLGKADAYRYSGLRVHGLTGVMTLLVVPTSKGVVGIGCRSADSETTFMARCQQAAGTLRLSGVRPLALGPDPAYARALASVLKQLDSADAQNSAALKKAKTRRAQASALGRLSAAQSSAAKVLMASRVQGTTATLNLRLMQALAGAANRFTSLSSAAADGNAAQYRVAQAQANRAQSAVHDALSSLHVAGYGSH